MWTFSAYFSPTFILSFFFILLLFSALDFLLLNPRALPITIFKSSQVIMIEGKRKCLKLDALYSTFATCKSRFFFLFFSSSTPPQIPFLILSMQCHHLLLSYNSVELSSGVVSALLNISDCIILYYLFFSFSLFLSLSYSVWCLFKKIIFCFSLFTKNKQEKIKWWMRIIYEKQFIIIYHF